MKIKILELIEGAKKAEGIDLTEEDFEKDIEILRSLNPEGTPSMRQDVLAGRPSEVELFAGTMLRIAAQHGIDVPVNRRYYNSEPTFATSLQIWKLFLFFENFLSALFSGLSACCDSILTNRPLQLLCRSGRFFHFLKNSYTVF